MHLPENTRSSVKDYLFDYYNIVDQDQLRLKVNGHHRSIQKERTAHHDYISKGTASRLAQLSDIASRKLSLVKK